MLAQTAWPAAIHVSAWRENRSAQQALRQAQEIARLAVRSLYAELVLYPKPGLVSLRDQGSHGDMDAACFMRSLFSLRHYFKAIALAGGRGVEFDELKRLGIVAEQAMLQATGGINTHRGAIFALGILCAAVAYCLQHQPGMTVANLRLALKSQWGQALVSHSVFEVGAEAVYTSGPLSHGQQVARQYAASGAREEAAAGFPSIFEIGLPRLRQSLSAGCNASMAQLDSFFALMAHISDTNIYHRGGTAGVDYARAAARDFLAQGGSLHPQYLQLAQYYHQQFIQRRLSPGGAADMLAASWFVHQCMSSFASGDDAKHHA